MLLDYLVSFLFSVFTTYPNFRILPLRASLGVHKHFTITKLNVIFTLFEYRNGFCFELRVDGLWLILCRSRSVQHYKGLSCRLNCKFFVGRVVRV